MNAAAANEIARAIIDAGSNAGFGADAIASALDRNLTSPNVSDRNLEPANVVDSLDRIASALFAIAIAINPDCLEHPFFIAPREDGGVGLAKPSELTPPSGPPKRRLRRVTR